MPTQAARSQGLLFSEPSIAETGIWCELNDGLDPVQWQQVCKHIGSLSPNQFKKMKKNILPKPDSLKERIIRLFTFSKENLGSIPVLSIGPSGINGEYQTSC